MSDAASLDPRLPVLVGVGQLNVRVDRGEAPLEPTEMIAQAARAAAADSGASAPDALLRDLDTVGVIKVMSWRYPDPAALVASAVGAEPARRWATTDGGDHPQSLLSRAASDISGGRADAVLIGGAEAWRTRSAARADDRELDWTRQPQGAEPTELIGDETPLASPDEISRGLFLPVTHYPMFESAVRAAAGRTQAEHHEVLGALWARFSEVAASNPDAWIREAMTAEEVRTPGPTNRVVGHPYTKVMNSNSSVEQAAAFLLCSVERARALGVPTDRWVFPWTGTDAHDTWWVGNRVSLHHSPAIGIAGGKALEMADVGVDDLAHVDVYSCFPSSVQVTATELGLDLERPLTVTGGLSFAGGPWNDYVSHSIATMARVLRDDAGSVGFITANGGFITKHALGVYSTTPPHRGRFVHRDCQAEVDDVGLVELVADWEGAVRIEGATVMHDRDGTPERAFLATRTPERHRAWCTSTDADVMALITDDEPVGVAAHRAADGSISL
ncbi:acetyl-CoA acetyltransferase [soil metagenome]